MFGYIDFVIGTSYKVKFISYSQEAVPLIHQFDPAMERVINADVCIQSLTPSMDVLFQLKYEGCARKYNY